MKNMMIYAILAIAVIGLLAAVFMWPAGKTGVSEEKGKLGVLVTIAPQAQFVERVGGDKVEVSILVPPGASPHSYEPTPQQMSAAGSAEIYARVGSGVEFELSWSDKIIALNRDMLVVDCSEGISIMEGDEEEEHLDEEEYDEDHGHGSDPHIWNSLRNAKVMVQNIYKGLVELDPENEAYYKQNRDSYLAELDALDEKIASSLVGESRKIMAYHDSWAYFAKDYGLEIIPIEAGGKEPTPQDMAALVDQAKAHDITTIFASPEFSIRSSETIAAEIGGSVALVSPLERDYLKNMGKVAEAFARV
jgi:zinc transport system substrate-binding protein